MGIEKVLLRINNCIKDLNIIYKVDIVKRNSEWQNKVDQLSNDYKNELKQIQFGKFININTKKFNINENSEDLIQIASDEKKLTNVEYKNLKINQNLSIQRERHPIIYLVENNKIMYFTTKTSKIEKFQKPIKDEMLKNHVKEYITTLKLIQNKDAYLSNATYLLEFKNEGELNSVIKNIENDELNLNYFFKNKDLRIYQKEKAFELFYKNILKKDPENLVINNVFEELEINSPSPLIDITFDKYVEDNIYRISNYESYRNESWMSYLKLHEIDDIKNKNDPSDI